MNLRKALKSGRLYFDGGYGTCFQARGLSSGELPELWNLTRPQEVVALHQEYLGAGCHILTANTFGANRLKFPGNGAFSLKEIITAAIQNAQTAIAQSGRRDCFVALDIGPCGRLLSPMGDLPFEEAVSLFGEVVRYGIDAGADLVLIETMNDSYETKAAVLAAKENSAVPIFVTNAYEESGKLMTGASPEAMVALLEGLQVDALGVNCSFGPEGLLPIVERYLRVSSTPVIVNPNAGLPTVVNGKTTFSADPDSFAASVQKIATMGAAILGGCCGTTPAHIRKVCEQTADIPYRYPTPKNRTVVSSYTHAVCFEQKPLLIGERINPTGKPTLKAALRENNISYVLEEGLAQTEAGAHLLDVNVGLPEIDEPTLLPQCVKALQTVTDLPLQIDSSDPKAMENALRIYNGKPLINSVNGKDEVLDAILPLAAKYGGAVIVLTLDKTGIPDTVDGRMAIVDKVLARGAAYGLQPKDFIIDPLALTVSADTAAPSITLECLRQLTARGLKTSLGVSNISFGLPERALLNTAFFTMAMENGLSAAIMNPKSRQMLGAYKAFCALSGLDAQCEDYIAFATPTATTQSAPEAKVELPPMEQLKRCVTKGLTEQAAVVAEQLLQSEEPFSVINAGIIPALDEIGTAFEQKKAFLPQLLLSAEAAKSAFSVISQKLSASGIVREKKYKIVLATVQGDIHDIGKNIVRALLENYDYDVIDLGKDVPPETVVEAVRQSGAPLVGLSALMTTTVPAMEKTVALLHENGIPCRVVVGGAVLNREYAESIGADFYAKDAMETVRYAETLLKES
ncbi:MAG: homocysteine S-methyltransferase family protein [Clostridia bacterium]|nr:homocysteine S-methyltransferase family protein [Clostridia bacterium]